MAHSMFKHIWCKTTKFNLQCCKGPWNYWVMFLLEQKREFTQKKKKRTWLTVNWCVLSQNNAAVSALCISCGYCAIPSHLFLFSCCLVLSSSAPDTYACSDSAPHSQTSLLGACFKRHWAPDTLIYLFYHKQLITHVKLKCYDELCLQQAEIFLPEGPSRNKKNHPF